jgi:hypothetical protein
MANFKVFKTTSSKMVCRGGEKNCIGIPTKYGYRMVIPKGTSVLGVSISGASGSEIAYYCEVCMFNVIERMEKIIEEVKRGHDVNGSIAGS